MSVTATPAQPSRIVPIRDRLIRPPDPLVRGLPLLYGSDRPPAAIRRLLHLVYRDCWSAFDWTYGSGGFWTRGLPPGLALTTNNIDPNAPTDRHLDYTQSGLAAASFDLSIFDPLHVADGGEHALFTRLYGRVTGTDGIELLTTLGALEAWRVARIGLLVKVTDSHHGGEYVDLSTLVKATLGGATPPARVYTQMVGKRPPITDPKHRAVRVPRSNGAVYLCFRKDSHKHLDFDKLYARQEMSRLAAPQAPRLCENCDRPLGDRRAGAITCTDRCRKALERRRRANGGEG